MQVFFIYWEVTKAWKVWLLLMRSVPKSAAIFLGQWLRHVRHAKTDKKEKKENKGHSALWAELKLRAFLGHWLWVPERAKTQKRENFSWRCSLKNREKHSESVREWKRKMRHFPLLKLHTRKINWWSSHGVFGCYNHGELEYLEEDFAIGFVVRLYLLIEIYLLYIQFIVNTSLA